MLLLQYPEGGQIIKLAAKTSTNVAQIIVTSLERYQILQKLLVHIGWCIRSPTNEKTLIVRF